ncbi:MAG: hypothetical protein GY861_20325 [bacterium]|nr:hypothetical protein [bacterium]
MIENRFLRQQDIIDPELLADAKVAIIGCGAVGSFTALTLAKMGIEEITIYDPDSIEVHNFPNQFFRLKDIDRKKVDAIEEIIWEFEDVEITPKSRLYSSQPLEGIVISAVDTMAARHSIWKSVKAQPKVSLYLDSRMASQVIQLYSYQPGNPDILKSYESSLVSDAEALDEPCTAKAIIYSVLPLAGLIARQVVAYLNGEWIEPVVTLDLKTLTLLKNGVVNDKKS